MLKELVDKELDEYELYDLVDDQLDASDAMLLDGIDISELEI